MADTDARTGDDATDQQTAEPDQQQGRTDQQQADDTDWKAEARKWEQRAKERHGVAKERDSLKAELEKLQEQNQTEQEKAINAAKKAGMEEATSQWQPKYLNLVRTNAALSLLSGRVKAPRLVLPHLGLDSIEVDENGQVDEAALRFAVDKVLDEYPFLASDDSSGNNTHHHGDMGPRRSTKGKHDPDDLLRTAFRR
jgi:hypothetical protein